MATRATSPLSLKAILGNYIIPGSLSASFTNSTISGNRFLIREEDTELSRSKFRVATQDPNQNTHHPLEAIDSLLEDLERHQVKILLLSFGIFEFRSKIAICSKESRT